jgi:DNA mismatch endonuclease (patch repair protein)
MSRTRGRDTRPELELRSSLHRRGFRFRVDRGVLPDVKRRVDIVFPRERLAVFVDGCYWHGCPAHRTQAKANASFWREKIESNIARDRDTDARLRDRGWEVIRVWEHDDVDEAVRRIGKLLLALRDPSHPS